jgi:hypothetical protein
MEPVEQFVANLRRLRQGRGLSKKRSRMPATCTEQALPEWAILDSNQGPLLYQERAGAGAVGSFADFSCDTAGPGTGLRALSDQSGRLRLP